MQRWVALVSERQWPVPGVWSAGETPENQDTGRDVGLLFFTVIIVLSAGCVMAQSTCLST